MFLRVDEGDNYTLGNSDIKNIKFNEYDIVIVSDYNKGFISDNDLIEISKRYSKIKKINGNYGRIK